LQRQLLDLISGLVADAAEAGARYDKTFVPRHWPSYCAHALAAAGDSSTTAIDRLVDVVRTGITSTRSTQTHGEDSAPSETRRTDEHH
jgi:hypothetical protein